jgi:predicted DNA-binding transcriptional regulator AlpA
VKSSAAAPAVAEDAHTNDVLLTTAQVADLLQVGPQTLVNWRSTRAVPLPFVKIGGCVRYWRSDVLTFLVHSTIGRSTG